MMAAKSSIASEGDSLALDLLDALCGALLASEDALNALDRAIGDGDHGGNLARAARSLMILRSELIALSLNEAIIRAGRAVVMSVGGASGPLCGTLLMEMGKALPRDPALPDFAAAVSAGVDGVARRGRSQEGDKTMLDVLAPASRALAEHASAKAGAAVSAMRDAAAQGLEASRLLRAKRGRAAYVGDRSIGHDDPGAHSALICIRVVADFILEKTE
jgi:dihydroxyacetone kinase-like protein